MSRNHQLDRLMMSAVIVGVVFLVSLVLEVVDRLAASPAMRRRVNEGSDTYFRAAGSVWQSARKATGGFLGQFGRGADDA